MGFFNELVKLQRVSCDVAELFRTRFCQLFELKSLRFHPIYDCLAEHRADGALLMNPPDRFAQHVGDREHLQL